MADGALDRVEVASPCNARWADMSGDERVRFCGLCRQHVYDLSSLTRAEAAALLSRGEERRCIRFFRRADGTVLTADCPDALRRTRRRGRLLRRAAAVALGALGLGAAGCSPPHEEVMGARVAPSAPPPGALTPAPAPGRPRVG